MAQEPTTFNTLFYGDNLHIMRKFVPDASVDLVYLDPPFRPGHNVPFGNRARQYGQTRRPTFDDPWHWTEVTERTYGELLSHSSDELSSVVSALRTLVGTNKVMAYLVMMGVRLVELHRVLKQTGSLYLHCDPTSSHYLKILLDAIFGPTNFRSEIIWKRTNAPSEARYYGTNSSDTQLCKCGF